MAETIVLEATKRDVLGKQVKHLRGEGWIPGVLYGSTFESIPLQVEWIKLRQVLREAGGSHLIQIKVGGENHNALVREVQRDPIRGDVLHVDFYRVRMDVLVRTESRVTLVGSDAAIIKNGGLVVLEMNTVLVECMPGDLPAQIEIDQSRLTEIGASLLVRDLPALKGVRYVASDDDVVVYAIRAVQAEEEEEVPVETAEPELIRRRPAEGEEEEEE
jgi:large subunit ribosomal protein L25